MTASHTRREVFRFTNSVLEAGLALDINTPVIVHTGTSDVVTWTSASPPTSSNPGYFATALEYRWYLENRQYNILLADASLLQVTYEFAHNDLVKHRLCYYPCPIELTIPDPWAAPDISDLFDQQLLESLENLEWLPPSARTASARAGKHTPSENPTSLRIRLRSPLRFDFDAKAGSEEHPASHVHISQPACRIPVSRPLSFGHFVTFILRYFYPAIWADHEFIRTWPLQSNDRVITAVQETSLHFDYYPTNQ
jgi:hypothetical protein